MKALFVCTGNSCRSVMAEYVFNHLAGQAGLRGWEARSCGTAAQNRFPIPKEVKAVLAARGIGPVEHVPTLVNPGAMNWADKVFAMARQHLEALERMHPQHRAKLGLFLKEAGSGEEDVEDPIGRSEEVYAECCRVIEQGVRGLLQRHEKTARPRP